MMDLITPILLLLSQIAGVVPAGKIGMVIATLEEIVPIAAKLFPTLYQVIKNIIAALRSNPATDLEQIKNLETLDQQVDAEFEAAATDAQQEDAEADNAASVWHRMRD